MVRAHHGLYLADNVWLIGHDEDTGKPHIAERAMGMTLAGCLLGELVLHNAVAVSRRGDIVVTRTEPPSEALAAQIFDEIATEQGRPRGDRVTAVRDWLTYLGESANRSVIGRLMGNGLVERVETRQLLGLRRTVTHRVTDVNLGVRPAVHISSRLINRHPLRVDEVAFAGFALVAGLEKRLLLEVTDQQKAYVRRLMETLPESLRSLLAETESAIGDAVLSHRIR